MIITGLLAILTILDYEVSDSNKQFIIAYITDIVCTEWLDAAESYFGRHMRVHYAMPCILFAHTACKQSGNKLLQ